MKVDGKPMRTIWLEPDGWSVGIIDQTALPHRLATARLTTLDEAARDPRHADTRRTVDRRGGSLWCLLGAASGRFGRIARSGLRDAARHAPDGDQSQMGAR